MGLQFTEESGIQGMEVFQVILETLTSGFTVDETNNNLEVGHTIQKGHLVQYDEATRLILIDKLAMVQAGTSDTDILIEKGSGVVVGDILSTGAEGGAAYAVTSIDRTTSADYDALVVATAIGTLSAGDILWLSSAAGATAGAYAVDPNGVMKNDVIWGSGNESVAVVVRGTLYERRLPGIPGGGVIAAKKTLLTDRILFSQSL